MTSAVARQAEELIGSRFDSIGAVTKYIHAFRTRRGREIAVERSRDGIYIWTEQVEGLPVGLEAPEAYEASRSRNSNLSQNAKRLAAGRPALYWRLKSAEELVALCDWYSSV